MLGWVGKVPSPASERLGLDPPLELAEGGPYCLLSTRKGHLAE